ncbi:MAG: (2Fe-2S)-binding protein [Firmicutes bacterium]|nr:(2Fe-2S)-binding protein [Dethiobacter sp.]MBS3889825.1 (2Fe-2S)-binding protein [Bacillota bacterium]MBS4054334.1 (2Fe-2S)-binding protein [Thermaerobacter sp.]
MKAVEQQVIICRCEDLTLADVRALIEKGYRTLDELRRISRLGMGPCQGRTCRPLVQRELQLSGIPLKQQSVGVFRPPAVPVALGAIAEGSKGGFGHA